MNRKLFNGKILSLLLVFLVLFVVVGVAEKERADAQTDTLEGLSFIELTQRLTAANHEMYARERSGDTPLYRIDDERLVSEEDVAALFNVLTVRHALQQSQGFKNRWSPGPTVEAARDFLIRELLLTVKAQELSYHDLQEDVMFYIKEGWLQPEPPTPDASDHEALVRQGLMRAQLWRGQLMSAQDTQLPFEDSIPLIDVFVHELYEQFAAPNK